MQVIKVRSDNLLNMPVSQEYVDHVICLIYILALCTNNLRSQKSFASILAGHQKILSHKIAIESYIQNDQLATCTVSWEVAMWAYQYSFAVHVLKFPLPGISPVVPQGPGIEFYDVPA